MRKGQTVRSELPSNRETRESIRVGLRKRAFGIYRPLSEESATTIRSTLVAALKEVAVQMIEDGVDPPKVVIPEEHAVTYLEWTNVLKALKDGSLRNMEVRRLKTDVENLNYLNPNGVSIELSGLDWFGRNERKLAGRIAVNSCTELTEQTEVIDEIFHTAGAPVLEAAVPHHVSLCRYRAPRNAGLAARHRAVISETVIEHFQASKIESLTLGHLVVGPSYSRSLEIAA